MSHDEVYTHEHKDCRITHITQTIIHGGEENGNCFQAAVASLLNMPLDAVPHFCAKAHEDRWRDVFTEWLGGLGLAAVEIIYEEAWVAECLGDTYYILSGQSPRFGGEYHAVVAKGAEIVHDPFPGGGWLAPATTEMPWLALLIVPNAWHHGRSA